MKPDPSSDLVSQGVLALRGTAVTGPPRALDRVSVRPEKGQGIPQNLSSEAHTPGKQRPETSAGEGAAPQGTDSQFIMGRACRRAAA